MLPKLLKHCYPLRTQLCKLDDVTTLDMVEEFGKEGASINVVYQWFCVVEESI